MYKIFADMYATKSVTFANKGYTNAAVYGLVFVAVLAGRVKLQAHQSISSYVNCGKYSYAKLSDI